MLLKGEGRELLNGGEVRLECVCFVMVAAFFLKKRGLNGLR